jgi:hypothetical protein
MSGGGKKTTDELLDVLGLLASGAELGAQRAGRARDPILRARWLAIAGARGEQRDRVTARLVALQVTPPQGAPWAHEAEGELSRLLRADLSASHVLAARCRRVARLARGRGDLETAASMERLAAESLAHATELARCLAHHYVREALTMAQ